MALAVPLSRFTPRVGGGSAFFVRHHLSYLASAMTKSHRPIKMLVGQIIIHQLKAMLEPLSISIIGIETRPSKTTSDATKYSAIFILFLCLISDSCLMPNKSPEPTAVGAVSSAIAVHAAGRRWLSFHR